MLPILLAIIGGVSVVGVSALTTFDNGLSETPVNVLGGNLNIVDGGMIFTRTDGIQTALTVRNTLAQTAVIFEDADSSKSYVMRYTPDGLRFDFLNLDGGVPRVDLNIQTTTGNIGMGTFSPAEKLDVFGNIHLSGVDSKITSNGDICIGTCP